MWPFRQKSISQPRPRSKVSIRMEAIGGQGANSAGKILAEAAVLGMHFTGNHFSSFGSEKRGSPVRSFVRFSPEKLTIRSASFIKNPDVLVVFQESLLLSHPEILEGVSSTTDLILNSASSPEAVCFTEGVSFGKVVTVDATRIAQHFSCGLNAVMLGACSASVSEVDLAVLESTFSGYFSRLPAEARKNNLAGFKAGRSKAQSAAFQERQSKEARTEQSLPRLGYLNAPIGGLITNPGNTVLKDNSASRRGVLPRFLKEVCFHCGYCDMACPDYCFVWKREAGKMPELQGIDYQFCKGCQKCIVACPAEALIPATEEEVPAEERNCHLFPEAEAHLVGEKWRKADWGKMVGELSPEARMLTIQTELLDPLSYIRPDFSKLNPKKNKQDDQ